MTDLEQAKKYLAEDENATLVLCKENAVYKSQSRGVAPMMQFLEEKVDLTGFSAADKVVGKAAAFLFVLAGVAHIHARLISKPALKTLEKQGIAVTYDAQADYIINRTKTGMCPMEQTVLEIENPQDAFYAIQKKLKELQK